MNSFGEVFEMVKTYCLEVANVGDIAFKLWINPLEPVKLEDNVAYFTVKSSFQRNIITKNYEKILLAAFANTLGFDVTIHIDVTEEDEENGEGDPISEDSAVKQAELMQTFRGAEYDYTFDTFIVGRSNEFAYAACTAVAKNCGSTYNPLFLHGPSGLGKTHLLNAISHEIKRNNPDTNIIYVTGEVFANELIAAIQNKDTSQFHKKYRSADVLLVDDIQFIAGKESTQEEFFHTFNTLHTAGKQIILTSDRPPQEIAKLEERLKSRFAWGLIADIKKPDVETRIAILREKARQEHMNIPSEVLELIAAHVSSNIRELEGSLIRLNAYAQLVNQPITVELCQEALREVLATPKTRQITAQVVMQTVSDYYGVTVDDMIKPTRRREITVPRQIAMYLTREMTNMSLPQIGQVFGNRDHSTVLHACKQVEGSIRETPSMASVVNDIKGLIMEGK